MSWIKKTESELEDEKKKNIASLAEEKKEQEQEETIPIHPYNILHSSIQIKKQSSLLSKPSWLNKDTKDNIKKTDEVKTMDNPTENNLETGWKKIPYPESLQNIAKMIKSSNENNNSDKLSLYNVINK